MNAKPGTSGPDTRSYEVIHPGWRWRRRRAQPHTGPGGCTSTARPAPSPARVPVLMQAHRSVLHEMRLSRGCQAALGSRSCRRTGTDAGPRPAPEIPRNNHGRPAWRERRHRRARAAAAASARSSLLRSVAIVWAITGCMTCSSVAGHPSRAVVAIVLGGYDSSRRSCAILGEA